MCLTPNTIKAPAGYTKSHTLTVPCGKCPHCIKSRRDGWAFRLQHEKKRARSAGFVTFTYETCPESFNGLWTLDKKDFQKFMKRLRHEVKKDDFANPAECGVSWKWEHYRTKKLKLPRKRKNGREK